MPTVNNSNTVSRTDRTDVRDVLRDQVVELVSRKDGSWAGTATQLGRQLVRQLRNTDYADLVPSNPSLLRRELNRALGKIRARGISVEFYRSGVNSDKVIEFSSNR